jgi:hypothetical protein
MTSAFDFETVDGESAWAQVSSDEGRVRLVVSIATDGDVDVLLDPVDRDGRRRRRAPRPSHCDEAGRRADRRSPRWWVMLGARRLCRPVDESFRFRHGSSVAPSVESPSRAAGGFPTLGGGMRALPRAAAAGPVAATAVRPQPSEEGV